MVRKCSEMPFLLNDSSKSTYALYQRWVVTVYFILFYIYALQTNIIGPTISELNIDRPAWIANFWNFNGGKLGEEETNNIKLHKQTPTLLHFESHILCACVHACMCEYVLFMYKQIGLPIVDRKTFCSGLSHIQYRYAMGMQL